MGTGGDPARRERRAGASGCSAEREHGVVAFAFAQEDVLAEEQVGGGERTGGGGGVALDVVHVNAAGLDVLARGALGGSEAGVHEQFGQRDAGTVVGGELRGGDRGGGDFADDVVEGFLGGVA